MSIDIGMKQNVVEVGLFLIYRLMRILRRLRLDEIPGVAPAYT